MSSESPYISQTIQDWISPIWINDRKSLAQKLDDMGIYNTWHLVQFPICQCQLADLDVKPYDELTLFESLLGLCRYYTGVKEPTTIDDNRQTIKQWITSQVQIKSDYLVDECVMWLSGFGVKTISDLYGFKFQYQLLTNFSLKLYEKLRMTNALNSLMKRSQKINAGITPVEPHHSSIPPVPPVDHSDQNSDPIQLQFSTQYESRNQPNSERMSPPAVTETTADLRASTLLVKQIGSYDATDVPCQGTVWSQSERNKRKEREIQDAEVSPVCKRPKGDIAETVREVDIQAYVRGFDITQTGEIIYCTQHCVRMLSAVGKQVSVPFDTSDIGDPELVAVNQKTGDVVITQEYSRYWSVFIKMALIGFGMFSV